MINPKTSVPIFRILTIDGGGLRGIYPAFILKRIEDEWPLDWRSKFQLIAGTSTGAIIAAGLACGKSARDILALYEKHAATIFRRRPFHRFGLMGKRAEVLEQLYIFDPVPALDEERLDLHSGKKFRVRDYRVTREDGMNWLVSPYYEEGGGTVIDWMPVKARRASKRS